MTSWRSETNRFEWNRKKAKENLAKHGISFQEAIEAYEDPYALELHDSNHSYLEDRYYRIGALGIVVVLLVCFTEREGNIRLISARKATTEEKAIYEENFQNIR